MVCVVATSSSSNLVLVIDLLVFAVLSFAVWFAVEDELGPSIILLKNVHNILIVIILRATWIHERAVFQAVILAFALIAF